MADKTLVIATGNRGKSKEIAEILSEGLRDLGVNILIQADIPNITEADETGKTYAENAVIKSENCLQQTGFISIGDDVGLEIDALNGVPGLYSRRFGGEDMPFPQKIEKLLGMLHGTPWEKRSARFQAAIAISAHNITTKTFTAHKEGFIAEQPSGKGGFGYDPIFFLPEFNCTMADLPPEHKNKISHRGIVLTQTMPFLRQLFFQ